MSGPTVQIARSGMAYLKQRTLTANPSWGGAVAVLSGDCFVPKERDEKIMELDGLFTGLRIVLRGGEFEPEKEEKDNADSPIKVFRKGDPYPISVFLKALSPNPIEKEIKEGITSVNVSNDVTLLFNGIFDMRDCAEGTEI